MPNDFTGPRGVTTPAPRPTAPSPRTGTMTEEIEMRAGIEPVEQLLATRQALIGQVATLRAVYGSFGTWDHSRKSELARIKSLIRLQSMKDSRKLNNDQVDEEAHAHPDYTAFVVLATQERAAYFRLEAQVESIDYRINRGQALIRYVASEPRI